MKTQLNQIDELNASLHLTIEPEDFMPEYERQIKQINKTSKIPGFRPGHVPKSMIEQRFGESVLVESVLNTANEKVNTFIKDEKLDILGYPITNENQPKIETFKKDASYDFIFDLGFTPKVELNLEGLPAFEKMSLLPTEAMIEEEIDHISRRFGKQEEVESALEEDSMRLMFTELNDASEPLEGGLNKSAFVLLRNIQDAPTKEILLSAKKGDTVKVNIFNVFNNDQQDMMHALGTSNDAVQDLSQNFSAVVESITHIEKAANNQELWDMTFGPGTCSSEEDFRKEISQMLVNMYEPNTVHILEHNITDDLINHLNIPLPDEFMKRWLLQAHPKEYSAENIDKKYQLERRGLQWQLIREQIEEKYNLSVDQEAMEAAAFQRMRQLFAQVGLQNTPYEQIHSFAMDRLKDEKFVKEVAPAAMQQKVMEALKSSLKIEQTHLPMDELIEKIKAHNAAHHAHDHEHDHEHEHAHSHDEEHQH